MLELVGNSILSSHEGYWKSHLHHYGEYKGTCICVAGFSKNGTLICTNRRGNFGLIPWV